MKLLTEKNILITGCARGIGRMILKACAENGANVWANARNKTSDFEEMCRKVSEEHSIKVTPVYFDLKCKDEIVAAVKKIRSEKVSIDGLVNNAGITYNALFQMSSERDLHENIDVNFVGPLILTQYICKLMARQNSGSIVSITSSAAHDANSGRAIYGASKAALSCATKALSREVGVLNIRANSIAPGITETEMLSTMSDEVISETASLTALKRCGKPSEIANVAVFLLSDWSSYITGQTIRVDGGM
jgi:3-oxoacyl-[acyl-carrier protein] reductase